MSSIESTTDNTAVDALIDLFFDLDGASLPSSGYENIGDEDIPGFVPITGRKEDKHATWLGEALAHENPTGGRGPFVHAHSSNVFMGHDERLEEQVVYRYTEPVVRPPNPVPPIQHHHWEADWSRRYQPPIRPVLNPVRPRVAQDTTYGWMKW